ncbi:MAG: hypothetical protein H0T73_20360 [Ardenticatenales bacterium]|nr:hypothetical protein [Ardenticatenales bacterium]
MARETVLGVGSAPTTTEASTDSLADRPFLLRLGLFYVALSLAMLFSLDRYWSANWDVEIFLHAARTLWDGGSPFDLYEKSRAAWPWPYPYPPLYALLLAPFVWLADMISGSSVTVWSQLIAVRLPVFVADLAIAALLHRILRQATGEQWIARLGAALWLLNPILFYQTAVQAHQESIWLWPTLVAYAWVQEHRLERAWWPMLLLALAITLKQSAVIYAIPFGLFLLWERRWLDIAMFAGLFALIFGAVSLPFALYSDDFRYMVFEDVRKMPVQVQSWQVWTLALPDFLIEQTRTTFPTVRYAALLTVGAASLLSVWALWKQRSWYVIGVAVTLAFVLTSQKVMAYHYPMLLPWLIAYALRPRRFALLSIALLWTSWVLVSPYFAPWANASHLLFYASLGTLNSLFYGWLLWQVLAGDDHARRTAQPGELQAAVSLSHWLALLALAFALACVAHPLRAALPNTLTTLLLLLGALLFVVLLLFPPIATWGERVLALPLAEQRRASLRPSHLAVSLLLVPLFFTWFTMSAEITAVIEKGILQAWGLQ